MLFVFFFIFVISASFFLDMLLSTPPSFWTWWMTPSISASLEISIERHCSNPVSLSGDVAFTEVSITHCATMA